MRVSKNVKLRQGRWKVSCAWSLEISFLAARINFFWGVGWAQLGQLLLPKFWFMSRGLNFPDTVWLDLRPDSPSFLSNEYCWLSPPGRWAEWPLHETDRLQCRSYCLDDTYTPPYVFIAWCLIKYRGSFTILLLPDLGGRSPMLWWLYTTIKWLPFLLHILEAWSLNLNPDAGYRNRRLA
jgi:hypothetical protein